MTHMAAVAATASNGHPSLLELLMKQQTHGDPGLRLRFHEDLLQPLAFERQPYHFCATRGNIVLPLYLYVRGLPAPRPITVAAFAACGAHGSTPWRKDLTISASEAALLAGDGPMSRVLANIERGVPLHWSPSSYSKYPKEFRTQAKSLARALAQSGWFMALPGPAQSLVLDKALSDLARFVVWGMVEAKMWEQSWEELLHPTDREIAKKVLEGVKKSEETAQPHHTLPLPQYHFRMAAGLAARRRPRMWTRVARMAVSGAAIGLAARTRQPVCNLVLQAAGLVASAGSPLCTVAWLLLGIFNRPSGR